MHLFAVHGLDYSARIAGAAPAFARRSNGSMTRQQSSPLARIRPVILSGGSGTRLWPLSRERYPKQFLPLVGEHSMLQETLRRCAAAGLDAPMLVGGEDTRFILAEQARAVGQTPKAILLEPGGRNTAPAIAAAALVAAQDSPDTLMLVLPADHVITDVKAWTAALGQAAAAATAGHLVTFGINPTHPETGYGYIRRATALDGTPGVFQVAEFVEKPVESVARGYIESGNFLWNSGMFLFRAGRFLEELARFEPELVEAVRTAVAGRREDLDFLRLEAVSFAAAKSVSVDDAVFARTDKAAVVPCSIGWSDVGSFKALLDVLPKDEAGNAVRGDVFLRDAQDCFVRGDDRLTVLLGVEGLVVVATDDVVLVAHKDRVEEIKQVVKDLKGRSRKEAVESVQVYRPWGFYRTVHAGERFQVKRITVKPGAKLSLQKHHHRAEHWIVVNGTALVTRDGEEMLLGENQSVYLPLGCVHRLENPGKVPLNLIEVQSGPYLGEDDIVRFEDTYGRT